MTLLKRDRFRVTFIKGSSDNGGCLLLDSNLRVQYYAYIQPCPTEKSTLTFSYEEPMYVYGCLLTRDG